jgi:hypothetical protein
MKAVEVAAAAVEKAAKDKKEGAAAKIAALIEEYNATPWMLKKAGNQLCGGLVKHLGLTVSFLCSISNIPLL